MRISSVEFITNYNEKKQLNFNFILMMAVIQLQETNDTASAPAKTRMCEDFRFKYRAVKDGKIPQWQGYNIWKRIQSDRSDQQSLGLWPMN